jgi:hypothetical protein
VAKAARERDGVFSIFERSSKIEKIPPSFPLFAAFRPLGTV